MVSTDTYSSESDGVHGNPTESILVHRNYWSCDKPNLKQVQYKPDMRMTRTDTSFFKPLSKTALYANKYSNVVRYLDHEANKLISSVDKETYTSLFYLKHSPMQCTWEMPRFLGHKAKQLISSANDLQRLTVLYIGKCSKLGIWLNMPRF